MSNAYLALLGLARRAGFVEIGDEASKSAITKGTARLLLISADASQRTRETFEFIAESAGVPHITVSQTREELGNALGKRPCGIIALCDIGFTKAILEKLAGQNEKANALLPEVTRKADKIKKRRKQNAQK